MKRDALTSCAVIAATLALALALLPSNAPLHRIIVSSDQWHSAVAIPDGRGGFEEWGFASRIWYFEQQRGLVPLVQTLMWLDGPGVIERVHDEKLLYQRSTQQPAYAWEFRITDAQLRALRAFLGGSHEDDIIRIDGNRFFHPARRGYHAFHTCHHWLARALGEAGITLRMAMCMLPELMWRELDRVSATPRITGP